MSTKHSEIDEGQLTRGELRKLKALRKSVGLEIADQAFIRWYRRKLESASQPEDANVDAIENALEKVIDQIHFPRGKAYRIRRGRGRIIVERVDR